MSSRPSRRQQKLGWTASQADENLIRIYVILSFDWYNNLQYVSFDIFCFTFCSVLERSIHGKSLIIFLFFSFPVQYPAILPSDTQWKKIVFFPSFSFPFSPIRHYLNFLACLLHPMISVILHRVEFYCSVKPLGLKVTLYLLIGIYESFLCSEQLLLRYLPLDHTLWAHELERKHSQYNAFKDEFLLNPVSFWIGLQSLLSHL